MADPTHIPIPAAAVQMGVSADTLRRMVSQGSIPPWAVIASGLRRPRHYIACAWLHSRATVPVEPPAVLSYRYAVSAPQPEAVP